MKTVMVIGAGNLQVPVIKISKKMGYKVVTIDGNCNSKGFEFSDYYEVINITDEDKSLDFAFRNNIDGVITVATDYGILSCAKISEVLNLKFPKYKICKIIKNKYRVRDILSRNKNIKFFELKTIDDIKMITNDVQFPSIMKPVDGSGSRGIYKVSNIKDIYKSFTKCIEQSICKKVIVETLIIGKEYGIENFVYEGKNNVLAIMEKTMANEPVYAELGHAVIDYNSEVAKLLSDYANEVIEKLGIDFGSVNMDVLVDGKNVNLIDIGVRAGGNLISSHIVPLSSGVDLYKNSVKACLGEKCRFKKNKKVRYIATRILDFKHGIVKSIDLKGIQEIKNMEYVRDIILNVDIGETIRSYESNLDSCGYVVIEGINTEDAKSKALEIRNLVEKNIEIE